MNSQIATNQTYNTPAKWQWFPHDRFGIFLHWGPYSALGHGEQALFRQHLDPRKYEKQACEWNPKHFNPKMWSKIIKSSGAKYACLTTRHHDGYCLWDTNTTNYSSAKQAPKKDFVKEYVEATREAGLKVGLYYSWLDWRLPSYFEEPISNKAEWEKVRKYLHDQVEELLTNYGKIDYFFFDGVWPRTADELQSEKLVSRMRELQPDILINNRLGRRHAANGEMADADGGEGAGGDTHLGDFGTPEHHITAENRLWESCQVSTWRLWGYTHGERWRDADVLLDFLCECAEKGGNLILNVGPDGEGQIPSEFIERSGAIGDWLAVHGEAIYGTKKGDVTEFVSYGRQTTKDNSLYLIFRFWDGTGKIRLADLESKVKSVTLLTTQEALHFEQRDGELFINELPTKSPTTLFPVIKVECTEPPRGSQWGKERLWGGDPNRVATWAKTRGNGFDAFNG